MLVHHVSRFLDSDTREAWETSLGASQEFPKFELLMEFLTAKARALERVEAANAQSKPTQRKATAHHASSKPTTPSSSANQSKPAPYACDMCNANHFIVTCEKFRQLTPAQRKGIAETKRLCYNCLGRHNARACRSTQGCKTCSARHHTMLHSTSSTPTQPTTSPSQQVAATSTSSPSTTC
ncbi:uncharacterized protein [Temnothorax nylanderi]